MKSCNYRQTELPNCTFVKTVLMLLVVLYHCMVFWTGEWFVGEPIYTSSVLSIVSHWLNSFHIYAFALVSGYLFAYLRYECGKYSEFTPFFVGKAKRLLVPYVFAASVWVIPFTVYYLDCGFVDIVKRFAFGTAPGQLWFLLMLFFEFAIFYPLSNIFRKHNVLGASIVVLIYGGGVVGPILLPNVLQFFRACTYVPLFWLGFKLRQWGTEWLWRIPVLLWLIAHGALFALARHLDLSSGAFFSLVQLGLDFVLHIVGALSAFVVLQKLADRVDWQDSKFFGFVSKLSMPVYLFHQQVIYVFVYALNGLLNPYLHTAVNFVGAMVVSLTLSAILMRFRVTRFLVGEK